MQNYKNIKFLILFIRYVLGYDLDFGISEASTLASHIINSPKLSEKYAGYMAAGYSL